MDLGAIPLVVFTTAPADDTYKAALTRIGNARYVRRDASTSVDAQTARLEQMMVRLTRGGR